MLPFRRAAMMMMMNQQTPYYQKVKNLLAPYRYQYLMLDDASGAVALDSGPSGYNGALTAVTYGNPGVGDGKGAVGLDGASSQVFPYTADLYTYYNAHNTEWSISGWAKTANWTVAGGEYIFKIRDTAGNTATCYIPSTNALLFSITTPEDGTKNYYIRTTNPNYFHWGMTLSLANSRVRFFYNGGFFEHPYSHTVPMGLTKGFMYGFERYNLNAYFAGNLAHCALVPGVELPITTMRQLATVKQRPIVFTVIGDSISNQNELNYAYQTIQGYPTIAGICNHAVGGMGVLVGATNMAVQVAGAANDDADIIIHELGTNDDNAGDMNALQAAIENGVAALKISNPRARQYYLGVLPRWTDNTGATPVDKANIRAAQVAACASQGITYWDTFTDPWITAADTSDGTHPTVAGAAKVAARVLALL